MTKQFNPVDLTKADIVAETDEQRSARYAKHHEARQKLMEDNPPVCEDVHNGSAYFNWSWQGCGFGQFSFSYDNETGKFSASTEGMGAVNSRKLLHAFADYVADNLSPEE